MKKFLALMLALTMAFSLVACGNSNSSEPTNGDNVQNSDSTPDSSSEETTKEPITFTDLDGKTYTFDEPIDKVIIEHSGGGGPFIALAAVLGEDLPKHLANLDQTLPVNRMDQYESYLKDMPELADLPDFGYMEDGTHDVEAGVMSGADAVLISLYLKPFVSETLQPKYEAAGIPVIYMDFHAETLENHTRSLEIIGKLFGREERAQEVIDFYTEKVTNVYDRVEELLKTNDRPVVHMETQGDPAAAVKGFSASYMWGALIYSVGGMPSGEGIVEKSGELQPEYILTLNPDKIFVSGAYWPAKPNTLRMGFTATEDGIREGLDRFINGRAGWDNLDAVKNGEVYALSHTMARDIYDCATIEALAKFVWPEEFSDLDPAATLEEFYDKFLPFSYGGIWYMQR